jgi:hypothetical protein
MHFLRQQEIYFCLLKFAFFFVSLNKAFPSQTTSMKKFTFFLGTILQIVLLLPMHQASYAQVTIIEGAAMNLTPQQLVQNYLIGAGITVSNATFNSSSAVISSNLVGTFKTNGAATTELGLRGGIIMTSGKASIAKGPNTSGGAGFQAGGSGDPDLTIIAGNTTYDKATLEFDFVPMFDTVRFRYVFGSEEFYEFCNQYNDAFGFFLSGPGINGTFSNNAVNIALMPGSTSSYVTINNICANSFSNWNNAGGQNYQYDGITKVFTSWYIVQPCSTYHIKLAIADAMDKQYDSGVFLEQNSFGSPGVTMENVNTVPQLGNRALEGCNDVFVAFKLSQPVAYVFRVNLTITGTAVSGVDYNTIPTFVTFGPGEDSTVVRIHPKWDTITEGPKSVIIRINQVSCTGTVARDTVWIDDYSLMKIKPNPDTTICHGTSVKLRADVTGGLRPFNYSWNVSPSTDSILTFIPPVGINNVILGVTDVCHLTRYDTSVITVHPTPIANAGVDMSIANGTSTTLHGTASGGYGNYIFAWTSNPPGFTSDLTDPPTGNLYESTIFKLIVTDTQSGCESEQDQVIIAIEGGPLSANPVAEPPAVCFGSTSHLYALPGGGSGLYSYSWTSDPPGFTSSLPDPEVVATGNTTYTVVVNDNYNQVTGSTELTVNPLPVIHLGPLDTTVCIYDSVRLDAGNPGSSYEWSNGTDARVLTISSSGIGFEVQTYTVWVTNENSCMDSATINVYFSFSVCVGVDEQNDNNKFNVSPNPTDGVFRIQFNPAYPDLELEILDLFGRQVFAKNLHELPGNAFERTVDASFLPKGLYLLRLMGTGFSGVKKIFIK